MTSLFDPFDLGTLRLSNRIVRAPMTRSRVEPGDALGKRNALYYAQRATAGLIVAEALVVDPMGRGYLDTPGIYTMAQIEGSREVARAVHAAGGYIVAQLWHVGRVSHQSVLPRQAEPLGPTSEKAANLYVFARNDKGKPDKVAISSPRAISDDEVDAIIGQFASTAENATRAEFDGVEVLAGNGYLFEQFLNSAVNRRTGRYGGDTPAGRTRLLLNAIDGIRTRLGAKALVGVRLSPFGRFNSMPKDDQTEETYLHLARELENRKVSYIHFNDEPVSIGHLNEDAVENTEETAASEFGVKQRLIPEAFLRSFRRHYHGAVVLCGGLDRTLAETILSEGLADLVAFGVPFIANPDLPRRLRDSLPLAEPDTRRFYGGDERGYSDYPGYGDKAAL